ncbi:MAG: BON domain-containing protein [Proteobacteria bacterium]|nr:BON domain-containing protein [Pseudomonadota bacterium]
MCKINANSFKLTLVLLTSLSLLSGCAAVVVGGAAAGAVVAGHDRRTTGTMVEDKSIQLKAMQAINEAAGDDPNVHVAPVSYNNRVLLIGQAPSRQMRSDIVQNVKNIEKVKQVHNEILLTGPSTMLQRSTDSWITTRIKSEMAVTKDFNFTRVKVTTENGIVYLMGIVRPQEEQIAVDIARHVKGVKKVVKIFEYDRS